MLHELLRQFTQCANPAAHRATMSSALDWLGPRMQVTAGRRNRSVAQDSLDKMNRCAALQAVSCVCVPQPMRAGAFGESCPLGRLLHNAQNSRADPAAYRCANDTQGRPGRKNC